MPAHLQEQRGICIYHILSPLREHGFRKGLGLESAAIGSGKMVCILLFVEIDEPPAHRADKRLVGAVEDA